MAVVEYYYETIYGIIKSTSHVDKVRTTFSKLFDDYNSGSCSSLEGISDGCSSSNGHSILGSSKRQSFDGFHECAKFHTLARMAHDILAIPTTTVALEAAFGVEGRVIDETRA
ncbi:hypothetical protein Vadar_004691 [Vaccinium darrowii]|uniref:Uncharacterized protein n=1 Tax=Vaccinium darrowii TaxID=229202 RepID=A0ACB7ZH74_9ERIC|nr:hypothetical protein Vadar_004691 [Vaccinium darrowii]